jgi:hypothetical protein
MPRGSEMKITLPEITVEFDFFAPEREITANFIDANDCFICAVPGALIEYFGKEFDEALEEEGYDGL